MNRILLSGALLLGFFAAACGGPLTSPPPPGPGPQGGYSLASLNGTYAFSMSGTDGNGFSIARIGSFHADGQGNITMAMEDVNDAGSFSTFTFTPAPASKYTMEADGKGELTLSHPDVNNANVADNFTFTIVLNSTSSGLLIETDGSSTMSGNFQLQNISTTFAPSYAFDFSGLDLGSQASASFIGQFTTNGTTSVTGGVMDVNDGASASGELTLQPGTITQDASNFSNFGRGTLTFSTTLNSQVLTFSYIFYVVDGSHMIFVENDSIAAATGSATAQSNVPTSVATFPGNFVFAVGGGAFNQSLFGPVAIVGRYTTDASGALSNIGLDQNDGGPRVFPNTGGFSNVAYTIDPAGTGRGTLTFTDVTSTQKFQFIFYLATPTQGFIQDNSLNVVADGSLTAQNPPPATTTPTANTLAGNWAINWSGDNLSNGFEEDFAGVITLTNAGSNNITSGVVDFAELGAGNIFLNVPASGFLTLQGDGSLGGARGNAMQLRTSQSNVRTFNFRAYVISNNAILLEGVDNGDVVIGTMLRQQ
jgi:hypothetical protein